MNKSLEYYIEKYSGILLGLVLAIFTYIYWDKIFAKLLSKDFLDKAISISTTLLGFLLAVLTLIIQSTSQAVQRIRENTGYKRLIAFNKSIVYCSALVCLLSLVLFLLFPYPTNTYIHTLIILGNCLNIAFFTKMIIDTGFFLSIFYIIISE